MYLEVPVKLVLPTKALETDLTRVWPLPCVDCHVSRQVFGEFRHEHTSYKGALVELPVCRFLL